MSGTMTLSKQELDNQKTPAEVFERRLDSYDRMLANLRGGNVPLTDQVEQVPDSNPARLSRGAGTRSALTIHFLKVQRLARVAEGIQTTLTESSSPNMEPFIREQTLEGPYNLRLLSRLYETAVVSLPNPRWWNPIDRLYHYLFLKQYLEYQRSYQISVANYKAHQAVDNIDNTPTPAVTSSRPAGFAGFMKPYPSIPSDTQPPTG